MRSPQKGPSPPKEKRNWVAEVVVNEVVEDHSVTRPDGTPYIKRYFRGRYLGKGGFAKCYELKSADSGKSYAAKVISKASLERSSALKRFMGEVKVHWSLRHENIVKFERFFEDKDNAYILLELCDNQSLIELLKRRKKVTETECQHIMWKLIDIVKYLHSNKVIHRDLKLGNIFLSAAMEIKVGDFGFATKVENAEDRRRTMCGTPNYIAPEILEGTNGHSFEVDVWALGVIMYTILIGRSPFETTSVKSTYKRIRANNYVFPANIPLSIAAKELIIAILHPDPAQRPSLDQMASSAFFSQSPFPLSLPVSCLSSPLVWHNGNPHLPCAKPRPPLADKLINVDVQSHDAPKFEGFDELEAIDKENVKSPNPHRSPLKVRRSPVVHLGVTRPKFTALCPPSNVRPNVLSPSRLQRPVLPVPRSNNHGGGSRKTAPSSVLPASSSSVPTTANTAGSSSSSSCGLPTTIPLPAFLIPPSASSSSIASCPHAPSSSSATFLKPSDMKPPLHPRKIERDPEKELIAQMDQLRVHVDAKDIAGCAETDEEVLHAIHDELEDMCKIHAQRESGDLKAAGPAASPVSSSPKMFVNKWVDYSNKYGIGYLLSNGNTGVHFNDRSVMVIHKKGPSVEHVPRPSQSEQRERFTLEDYPACLQKKVTLLKNFYQYLQQNKESEANKDVVVDGDSDVQTANDGPNDMVYVKKWLRTKYAILFRLSNGIVQVVFYDNTELILTPEERLLTYRNKTKERLTYALGSLSHPSPDLAKRIKYLKDILHLWLTRPS